MNVELSKHLNGQPIRLVMQSLRLNNPPTGVDDTADDSEVSVEKLGSDLDNLSTRGKHVSEESIVLAAELWHKKLLK